METIESTIVSSVSDISKFAATKDPLKQKWIFRGQTSDRPLATSLERLCSALDIPQGTRWHKIEEILLREFQRRFYHYETREPNDNLEWFATMQHYGASTRLLDWTYSPYVALYFALERATQENDCAVMWAIDLRWLQETAMTVVKKHPEYIAMIKKERIAVQEFMLGSPTEETKKSVSNWLYQLSPPENKFVFPATPFHLNTRLTVQKGLFISPVDTTETFASNIEAMPGLYDGYGQTGPHKKNFRKFKIHSENRKEILRSLQMMNVSADSLIPGLDGFARSLAVYHHRFDELE